MIVINLKNDLQEFWNKASENTHAERVDLWGSSIKKSIRNFLMSNAKSINLSLVTQTSQRHPSMSCLLV